MDGVGMVNASINSQRMSVAATTANKTESNHSRSGDFLALAGFCSALVFTSDTVSSNLIDRIE